MPFVNTKEGRDSAETRMLPGMPTQEGTQAAMDSRRRSILLWLIPIILTVALTSALMVAGRLGE